MILKGQCKIKLLISGARAMVQLVKRLLNKNEELNLDLQCTDKHRQAHIRPVLGVGVEVETGESLELTG